MDLSRQAIVLCAEGTQLEFEKRIDDARERYARVWDYATDDYEKCVAALGLNHQPAELTSSTRSENGP